MAKIIRGFACILNTLKFCSLLSFSVVLSTTPACTISHSSASLKPETFDAFVDNLAAAWVRTDPLTATKSQYLPTDEQDVLDRKLTGKDFYYQSPIILAERLNRIKIAQSGLEQLKLYSPAELSPVQRVSRAMIAWILQDTLRIYEFVDHRYVFNQHLSSMHRELISFLSITHPIRNPKDVENFLVRLGQLASVIDQGIVEARARAEQGVVPPKFILEATIDQLDRFLTDDPKESEIVKSLNERAAKMETISDAFRTTSVVKAQEIVRTDVFPAFKRIRALLAEQQKTATDDAGLWRLPRGSEAYAVALKHYTTTNFTPDQIHEIGLREVARVEKEMDQLLGQLGYTQGTLEARYKKLLDDSQPPKEPDPRPTILADFDRILHDAQERAAFAFDLRPKADVKVYREPAITETNTSPYYILPVPGSTDSGRIQLPLPGPSFEMLKMKTIAYHEGIPGHHFQLMLQQELREIPLFRRKSAFGGLDAFSEGWGLYAEHLASELGWYKNDPKGQLGQLSYELLRARRLVVDTGLHAKGWTRKRAIDYGFPENEVDRYVVNPGQACSYMIGLLKILEVRRKAQSELGSKFLLKEFHNEILRTGDVPFDVLEMVIDEWIAKVKAGA